LINKTATSPSILLRALQPDLQTALQDRQRKTT